MVNRDGEIKRQEITQIKIVEEQAGFYTFNMVP